jgi:NAD(P)-dependent dehydrogenase (short-subunit alcohol dehydrogenase family)
MGLDNLSKTYFITGASSGFGHALAEAALAHGDQVVAAARRTEALETLERSNPDAALAVRLDVTDATAREQAVRAALQRFGRVDVLANIAGRGSLGAAEEFAPSQLREQLELNFFAAAEMTRALLPRMRAQGGGHIINLTSIGGLVSFGGFGPYCASKFALEGWSEALRDEVKDFGIRVTLVEPGAFRTEFAGDKNMRPEQQLEAYRPVIEPIEKYLYGNDGKQPGDPHRAALAMIDVVESTDPPLRLILGVDALGLWDKKLAAMQAELTRWRETAMATAFDDAVVLPIGG